MKKTLILVVAVLSIMTTGCISIIETLTLKKDGSGTFTYTIDLDGMMEMGFFDQMRSMGNEEIGKEKIEIDTLVNIYESQKIAGTLEKLDDAGFWKKVNLTTILSENRKKGKIEFKLDFDDIKEVDYFIKNFGTALEGDETAGMITQLGLGGSNSESPYSLSKKWFSKVIKRAKQEKSESEISKAMEQEGGEMYKMMFQSAEYVTIYNLPKKAKKVSNDNAIISKDGKKVSLKTSLLDYMEGKADLSNEIKY